jgi:Cof subfamily protein (haloacid dehalogenase superfamily)
MPTTSCIGRSIPYNVGVRKLAHTASVQPDIRLVAIDLDGTLLTSRKEVCSKALAALSALDRSKVRIVIASARPPRSVRHIYKELGLDTWQVNYNGALIWDEPGAKPVFHRPMRGALVQRMIDLARDLFPEVLVHIEVMDQWYTDRDDHSFTTETGKLFKPDGVACFDDYCRKPVTKLMFLGKPAALHRIEIALRQGFAHDVSILHSEKNLIQVMHAKVSKAVAVAKVARHYGVKRPQILAIGDAPNDVGMLQLAGVAVAMGNAPREVKKAAHWIATTNDDFGVHAALARFGLCS